MGQSSTMLAPPDLAAIARALEPKSDPASVELRAKKRKTALLLLTGLRVLFGAAMGFGAWACAEHTDAYVAAQTVTGLVAIALSVAIARGHGLRGALALVTFVSIFLPFVGIVLPFTRSWFDIRDTQIYCAVIGGKTMLLAAIVSPDIFSS